MAPFAPEFSGKNSSPEGLNVPVDFKKLQRFMTCDILAHGQTLPHLLPFTADITSISLRSKFDGQVQSFVQVVRQPSSPLQSILATKVFIQTCA